MFIISQNAQISIKLSSMRIQELFERVMEHRKSPWNSFSYGSDLIIMMNWCLGSFEWWNEFFNIHLFHQNHNWMSFMNIIIEDKFADEIALPSLIVGIDAQIEFSVSKHHWSMYQELVWTVFTTQSLYTLSTSNFRSFQINDLNNGSWLLWLCTFEWELYVEKLQFDIQLRHQNEKQYICQYVIEITSISLNCVLRTKIFEKKSKCFIKYYFTFWRICTYFVGNTDIIFDRITAYGESNHSDISILFSV